MDSTKYPYTQKSLIFGLIVGAALLFWNFVLPSSTGNSRSQPSETALPTVAVEPLFSPTVTPTEPVVASKITTTTPTANPPITPPTPTATPSLIIYTVKQGDILGSIAGKYGVSVEEIIRLNNITDPTLLQIDQALMIPVTATPTRVKITPSPTPKPVTYTIQPGDILLAIATEYSTTVEAIMIANDILNPRALQIGQTLIIPPDKGSILGVPTALHEITGGDTLLSLAAQYGSTVDDILATNPDLEPTRLQIGQQLVIPLTQPRPGQNPGTGPLLPRIVSPDPLPPGLASLAQQMIVEVNAQRQQQGLSALAVDEQLTTTAQAHAQDMVTRGYFSHVTPEGAALRDRLATQNIQINWTGENIQRNTQPYEQSAQYAVAWFMGSRPHRNNILHANYNRFGVGVAEGPPGWYTYVLVFGGD